MWFIWLWLTTHASVIDRVEVVIEEQLVMTSDIRLERALEAYDGDHLPIFTGDWGDPKSRLIDAAVIREAAGKLELYQPTPAQVQTRLASLRSSFQRRTDWEAFLQQHGLRQDSIHAVLSRRLIVEAYLRRNIAVDVSQTAQWTSTAKTHVDRLRARTRIRQVQASTP